MKSAAMSHTSLWFWVEHESPGPMTHKASQKLYSDDGNKTKQRRGICQGMSKPSA